MSQQAGSIIFANMKFPEYQFQEYPKWVTNEAGEQVVVQNHDEELIATGKSDGEAAVHTVDVEGSVNQRQRRGSTRRSHRQAAEEE
jgi:hypothetical protein